MTQKLNQLQQAIREVCPDLYNSYRGWHDDTQLQHILRAIAHTEHNDIFFSISGNVIAHGEQVAVYDFTKDLSAPENALFVEWAHSIICKG